MPVDPTLVRKPDDPSNLPVPAAEAGIEAYQHAPTLMAVDEPDTTSVRVWAPDKRLLRRKLNTAIGLATASSLVWLGLLLNHVADAFGALQVLIMLWFSVAILGGLSRRRRYITTDGHSIALVTQTGTRSLAWDEIAGCQVIAGAVKLTRAGGEVVSIPTSGYRPSDIADLASDIRSRASLQPPPGPSAGVWTRQVGTASVPTPAPAPEVGSWRANLVQAGRKCGGTSQRRANGAKTPGAIPAGSKSGTADAARKIIESALGGLSRYQSPNSFGLRASFPDVSAPKGPNSRAGSTTPIETTDAFPPTLY